MLKRTVHSWSSCSEFPSAEVGQPAANALTASSTPLTKVSAIVQLELELLTRSWVFASSLFVRRTNPAKSKKNPPKKKTKKHEGMCAQCQPRSRACVVPCLGILLDSFKISVAMRSHLCYYTHLRLCDRILIYLYLSSLSRISPLIFILLLTLHRLHHLHARNNVGCIPHYFCRKCCTCPKGRWKFTFDWKGCPWSIC